MKTDRRTKYEIFTEIILNFDSLQHVMILHIGRLIGDLDLAQLIFRQSNISFSFVERNFKNIVKLKAIDKVTKDKYKKYFDSYSEAKEYRNEVAHSGLGLVIDENAKITKKYIVGKNSDELTKKKLLQYDNYIKKAQGYLWEIL